MITFDLSGDLEMFQTTALDLARARLRPIARQAEADGAPPDALINEVAALGFGAVELPEAVGGLGLGLVTRVVVEEALAFGDLGITLALPGPGPFGAALLALGTDAEQAEHLTPLIESSGKGSIAWSEEKPRPKSFSTVAIEQADGSFRIHGKKTAIVAGHTCASLIVFARCETQESAVRPGDSGLGIAGPFAQRSATTPPVGPRRRSPGAFVVPTSTDGVRFSDPIRGLGLQAAPMVTATFEDVHVPAAYRLSGSDDRFADGVVTMFARIAVVAASRAVGLAKASFEYARDYAAEREAFGKPIAHFQGLAFLVADMATRVEVMRAMVARAAWSIDHETDDAIAMAAMAAAECHEGAMFVADSAVQVLGGAGYVQDHPVEKWMRDAKAHMAYGLPRQLCDLIVGRRSLEGRAADLFEDAPMPELQSVMV